jgi:hypothetical protein
MDEDETQDPDYGTAVLRREADGTITVESVDDIIGVCMDLLEHKDFAGREVDGVITLDTAGRYRYRRAFNSLTTPGVVVFHRLPDAQRVTADVVTDGG